MRGNEVKSVWKWYLRRHILIKVLIPMMIVGAVVGMFDNSVDYDAIGQGECFSNEPTEFITEFITTSCDTPNSYKVIYTENFQGRQFPVSWEQYAQEVCPLLATYYYYPADRNWLYDEMFMCIAENNHTGQA